MTGCYDFVIENNRISYTLHIERSITIIKGDSGIGKSNLIYMLSQNINRNNSGVSVRTNAKSYRVLNGGDDWSLILDKYKDTVFFADEYVSYILTKEFAEALKKSGSYLVYISRSGRTGYLSYSISSLCTLKTKKEGSKFANIIYSIHADSSVKFSPDIVITEDSSSGKDILSHSIDYLVESSYGKDNMINKLEELANIYKNIYIIVDGAAYGNQISKLMGKISELTSNRILVYAPESFEFMILLTSRFRKFCEDELEHTYDYAESSMYTTWENYFEDLLKSLCSRYNYVSYEKVNWEKLNPFFKKQSFLDEIRAQLTDLI